MRRSIWLLILAMSLGGCRGRTVPHDQDAGPEDAGHQDRLVLPDGFYNPACTEDFHCRVAVRTDNCCEAAYPEKIWIVDYDPCLEYWSAYGEVSVPQGCLDAWDPQCATIDCMPGPPPSRAARCTNGDCEFATECTGPTDCVVAVDTRSCCPCPTVVPRRLFVADECLLAYPTAGTSGCEPEACPAIPCQLCQTPTAACQQQTCVGQ